MVDVDDDVRTYVAELLERYAPGALVRDFQLYKRALTHRSAAGAPDHTTVHLKQPRVVKRVGSNERLEYLGDAVLYLTVASYLHTRYPDADEGFLTRVRTKLIQGSTLADLCARGTRLGSLLKFGQGGRAGGARGATTAQLEDAMEAFIGAVFEDQGFDVARTWLIAFLEDNIDFAQLVEVQDTPKEVLNRFFLNTQRHTPTYEELPSVGDVLHVRIRTVDGAVVATGQGNTLKRAQDAAARKALDNLAIAGAHHHCDHHSDHHSDHSHHQHQHPRRGTVGGQASARAVRHIANHTIVAAARPGRC